MTCTSFGPRAPAGGGLASRRGVASLSGHQALLRIDAPNRAPLAGLRLISLGTSGRGSSKACSVNGANSVTRPQEWRPSFSPVKEISSPSVKHCVELGRLPHCGAILGRFRPISRDFDQLLAMWADFGSELDRVRRGRPLFERLRSNVVATSTDSGRFRPISRDFGRNQRLCAHFNQMLANCR